MVWRQEGQGSGFMVTAKRLAAGLAPFGSEIVTITQAYGRLVADEMDGILRIIIR